MFLSNLSIKKPIMITMLLLVFIIFGTMAYFSLSVDLMPNVKIPYVTIQTVYPGAGPVEVETQVTKKIEDAVSTLSQIDEMSSYSLENVSIVIIKFDLDKDGDIANQEVKDKVDSVKGDLPDAIEEPTVEKLDLQAKPIITLVASGDITPRDLYELVDKNLKDRLSQIQGVAKVDIQGGEEREIQVELDNRTVYQNSISLAQLSQIIAAHNMDMPGGHFKKNTQEFSVRMKGQIQKIDVLKNLEIPTSGGIKKLSDVANVIDGSKEVRQKAIYFNNTAKTTNTNVIRIDLVKSSDGNSVKVAETVKNSLPEIEKELPEGVSLNIVNDESIFTKSSFDDTKNNIILGIIFTGLVLLFFLHDLRSVFIVALSMPTSIISTLMLVQAFDFTLNVMTLMGLSTSIGVLVANSVVVLENIFRHKEHGHGKKESARIGTAEVTTAVFASTLTNIVVFLPIASMSSLAGQFFKEFGLTVTFATIFSLIMSFTLTPMLASLILPEKKKESNISKMLEKLFAAMERFYKGFIKKILKNKMFATMVVLISFAALIVSFKHAGSKLGFEFMPMLDQGDIAIEMELPEGYTLNETQKTVLAVQDKLKKFKEIDYATTTLGQLSNTDRGTNLAKMDVKLIDAKLRTKTTVEVNAEIIEILADIPNAKLRSAAISSGGGDGGAQIEFYLQGLDISKLQNYSSNLYQKLSEMDDIVNLTTSLKSGKPEVTLLPKRNKLKDAGATVTDLAYTLRASLEGLESSTFKDQGEEYDIRIALKNESSDSIEEIKNLSIVTAKGVYTIGQLAEVKYTSGVSNIQHFDKDTSIKFTGSPAVGVPLGNVTAKINTAIEELNLESGYKVTWGGQAKMMNENVQEMGKTFILAILLTYMLLAAMLESFVQPIFILMTLPLAMIGVFYGMYLTGETLNMFAMMAVIMLVGIVVNNAILLLDYTKLLMSKGMTTHDALIEACPTKLKPILMSSLAIMLGMLPMAMGIGSAGKEFRKSMGIVSIGGLVVSTILALVVIPAVFYMFTSNTKHLKEHK